MTEETNVSFREAKAADIREDIAALEAKLAKKREQLVALESEGENEKAVADLKTGDNVAYVYGRGEKRRVLSGEVRAKATNEKGVTQLKVEYGTGLDAEFHLIDAAALLFTNDQIEATQKSIEESIAALREANEKAEAAKAGAK